MSLGSRGPIKGAADLTGNNPGNWTVVLDPDVLNCNMPYFEVCHIVIAGAPASSFKISIDLQQWDANLNGQSNSWDPSVALPLKPGQTLYFYWSDPTTDNNPPIVTVWMRYDQDIIANQQALMGAQTGG